MAHTPGPWTAEPRMLGATVVAGETEIARALIDTVDGNQCPPEETSDYNALLIAAAPELLTACHHAMTYIREKTNEKGVYEIHRQNVMMTLKAAINKTVKAT